MTSVIAPQFAKSGIEKTPLNVEGLSKDALPAIVTLIGEEVLHPSPTRLTFGRGGSGNGTPDGKRYRSDGWLTYIDLM